VATNLLKNLPKSDINLSKHLGAHNPGSIYFYPNNLYEITSIVSGMTATYSAGSDGIPPFLLKLIPNNILTILAHIFNLSLNKGKFISSFKKA